AAGVRRIEAVTGERAIAFTERQQDQLDEAAGLVKSDAFSVAEKVRGLLDRSKQLEKELQQLKDKLAAQESADLVHNAIEVKGKKLLVSLLKNGDAKALRTMVDDLKNQLGSGIVVLGLAQDDKVSLIAGVTKDLVGQVKAGELVSMLAAQVGGKGGGRPDMAQAGGSDAAALPAALDSVQAWVAERL
ncbi:MAG: DHHA1 domain-containing protein, partial [Plesiomonas shigelloides]